MTLNGRDGYEQCPSCHRPVWISQISREYNEAQQLAWFAKGLCKDCQGKNRVPG